MSDLIAETRNQLVSSYQANKDAIIKQAITDKLGYFDLEKLEGRCYVKS